MRGVGDRNILDSFAEDFCSVVQEHTEYVLVSGFVAISSGRARATEDIDIVARRMPKDVFITLHKNLVEKGFVCLQSGDAEKIYSYLEENIPVRYTRRNEPLPEMEFKMARDDVNDYQLDTRVKLPLTGLDLWFSSVPVNIAFKEELLKSDKDIKDAEHLRKVYPELSDEDEIDKVKGIIRRCRL